jgi:hypothetical protein
MVTITSSLITFFPVFFKELGMTEIAFSDEAKEVLEKFIASFPLGVRASYKDKIMRGVEYQLLTQGLTVVTKDVFFQSLDETFPRSFEPLILIITLLKMLYLC